ncbi:MAG: hypothetical protein O2887_10460 [Bacteroidetes bacterium]|nr:hypothetical protein [Bacteroidota bacterium]
MKGYELSRNFWNWAFDNPELITPSHAAIYFFAIEHCNRLGGKEKFGFPSQMTMDAIGIKKHQTYINYFNDLVDLGFFKLIQKSKNQYSANIISLVYALPEKDRALDKAFINHAAKQTQTNGQSTWQSKDSIVKQINNEQETNKQTNNDGVSIEIKKIADKISEKWNFSEQQNLRQWKMLICFIEIHGEKVKEQFENYWKYKEATGEMTHSFKNWIGQQPDYVGAWCERDWIKAYNGSKKKLVTIDDL